MSNLPVLVYLALIIFLIIFFSYASFYYRQAKKYSLEIGLSVPLWVKGIFVLLFTFLTLTIFTNVTWLVAWGFYKLVHF